MRFRIWGNPAVAGGEFQAEHADDGEGVGGGVDAGFELVVEGEGVVGVGAGHVDVEAAVGGGGEGSVSTRSWVERAPMARWRGGRSSTAAGGGAAVG